MLAFSSLWKNEFGIFWKRIFRSSTEHFTESRACWATFCVGERGQKHTQVLARAQLLESYDAHRAFVNRAGRSCIIIVFAPSPASCYVTCSGCKWGASAKRRAFIANDERCLRLTDKFPDAVENLLIFAKDACRLANHSSRNRNNSLPASGIAPLGRYLYIFIFSVVINAFKVGLTQRLVLF